MEGLTQAKYSPTYYLWLIELYSRNYKQALVELASETRRPHYTYYKKGQLFDLMGEYEQANANYDTARVLLKEMIEKQPENAVHYSTLGLVQAGLGNKDEAIRWGKKAVEMHPIRSDPYASGEQRLLDMAHVNIMVGVKVSVKLWQDIKVHILLYNYFGILAVSGRIPYPVYRDISIV